MSLVGELIPISAFHQGESGPVAAASSKFPKRKFSSFFKSLVIELDKDLYGPDNHLVEWHRTNATQETDGFQVCKLAKTSFYNCHLIIRFLSSDVADTNIRFIFIKALLSQSLTISPHLPRLSLSSSSSSSSSSSYSR